MFSHCNTLAELNAARVKAASSAPLVEVNNAYNKRRMELVNTATSFKKVETVPLVAAETELISYIPYMGQPSVPGRIEWTDNGLRA